MAEGFTTYETTQYILAVLKDDETIMSFFNAILMSVDKDEKIKWNHANRFMHLGNPGQFRYLINKNNLDAAALAKNIRPHIINKTTDVESNIVAAINANLFDEEANDLLVYDDFAHLLAKVFLFTLEHQETDKKNFYKDIYKDLADNNPLPKKKSKKGSTKTVKKVNNKFVTLIEDLRNISVNIHEEVITNKKRYNATNIESKLLSLGYTLDTTGSADDETKPLMSFFNDTSNHLLVTGDGGIGKTTFLLQVFNDLLDEDDIIPIFLPLTKLKANNLSSYESYIDHAILKRLEVIAADNLTSFDKTKTSGLLNQYYNDTSLPTIVFLLDGFNEISDKDNSDLTYKIAENINALAKKKNVRIILSSRHLFEPEKTFDGLTHIEANGVNNEAIHAYLTKENIPVPLNYSLLEILRSPLFLIMYADNYHRGVHNATTRGAILYAYFNGSNEFYSESLAHDPKANENNAIPSYIPFLMDFIFPYVSAKMSLSDSFTINTELLFDIVTAASSLVVPITSTRTGHYENYYKLKPAKAYAREVESAADVLEVITNRISFLQLDAEGNLEFTHQYIKDYFEAIFYVNALSSSLDKEGPYFAYLNHSVNETVQQLILESAALSNAVTTDKIMNAIDSLNGEDEPIVLSNLLSLLSLFNEGSLAGFDFKNVNFSSIMLSEYRFHAEDTSSTFTSCMFSKDSFASFGSKNKFARCFAFYEDAPVICELNLTDRDLRFKVIDYKTNTVIKTYGLQSSTFSKKANAFKKCDSLIVSDDFKDVVFYDSTGFHDFFYRLDLRDGMLIIHYIKHFEQELHMFIKGDKIYALCGDKYLDVYDATYREPVIIDEEEPFGDLLDDLDLSNYNGFIKTLELPSLLSDEERFQIPGGELHLPFCGVELSDELELVLIFNDKSLKKSILVYSINDESGRELSLPDDVTSAREHNKKAYYLYKDLLYFTFDSRIMELNIKTGFFNYVYEKDEDFEPNYIVRHNNALYFCYMYSFYEYDLIHKQILSERPFQVAGGSTKLIANNKYMICGMTENQMVLGTLYRFDKKEVEAFSYGLLIELLDGAILEDGRTVLVYSNGYVAIIGPGPDLSDCFFIPKEYDFCQLAYSREKEHLAVSLQRQTDNYMYITDVYIFDVADGKHDIIKQYSHAYPSKITYSEDGSLYFEEMLGTIEVRDTEGYSNFHQIEIGEEVVTIDCERNHLNVILRGEGNEFDTNFNYDVLEFDIKDITAPPYQYHMQDGITVLDEVASPAITVELTPYIYRFNYLSNYYDQMFDEKLCTESCYITIHPIDLKKRDVIVESKKTAPLTVKFIPALMIKDCKFHHCQALSWEVIEIIKQNLGIVVDC